MLILEISLSGFSRDGRVCSGLCNIYFREIRITYSDLRRWFVKFFFLIRRRYVGYRIATTSSRDTYRVYLLRIKRAVKYPSHSPSLSSSFHHRTIQVSKTKVLVLLEKYVNVLKNSFLVSYFWQLYYYFHGVKKDDIRREQVGVFYLPSSSWLLSQRDKGRGHEFNLTSGWFDDKYFRRPGRRRRESHLGILHKGAT